MADLTTYEFYRDSYYGDTVSETDFPKWLVRATDELNFLTCHNIDDEAIAKHSDSIQKAVCALMDTMFDIQKALSEAKSGLGNIASRSSGGESITYNTKSEGTVYDKAKASVKDQKDMEYEAIKPYLVGTGLLYAGY